MALQPDNRLAAAIAHGTVARHKLAAGEGGSLSTDQAAQALGISKGAILNRYENRQLIAWRDEQRHALRFPVWQFRDQKVLQGIDDTLQILNAANRLDDFGRMSFCLSNHGFLGGKRPLDCLREGEVTKVLQAASGYVE